MLLSGHLAHLENLDGFGTYINFDNIMVSAQIPIPPAIWLFGSGLLGLIGIARKKRVTSGGFG